MHALLGEKISRVSHHQQQSVIPADQIMLHFESYVIAKIALIIFRLRRLIYVIVLFYKYAKRWYLYIERVITSNICMLYMYGKRQRERLGYIHSNKYVNIHMQVCIKVNVFIKFHAL